MMNKRKYYVHTSKKFRKDVRKLKGTKRYNMQKLQYIIEKICDGESLEQQHRNHKLKGDYFGYEECHIEPNWLLIYKIEKNKLILVLTRTGSHSDLFGE